MKLLVLDTHGGARDSTLMVIDAETARTRRLGLDYAPEIYTDTARGELLVVDTTFQRKPWGRRLTRCWLKRYSLDDLRLLAAVETPMRPMYTGYPGRSTRVVPSPSGRYILHLTLEFIEQDPVENSVYRMKVLRCDRHSNQIEEGPLAVDSCMVSFGHLGHSDEDLYFHLSCDFPSTVAFGQFSSAEYQLVRMIELRARDHSPLETCGSWADPGTLRLYCVDGTGAIYEVSRYPPASRLLTRLALGTDESVALQQLHGGAGSLFVGISRSVGERALSLSSEIWRVSARDGRLEQILRPPVPLLNFVVSDDGDLLAGTNPYSRSVILMDVQTGECRVEFEKVGRTPGEVQFLPELP